MYYCNCKEAAVASGEIKLGKVDFSQLHDYQQVETKDGFCIHCRHAAFWSKNYPTEGTYENPDNSNKGCFVNDGYKVSLWK